jgi:radical SAM protein with 4Fe4S-binding SPASM domain
MGTATLVNLIRYFAKRHCAEVHFTGGEPLVRSDIFTLIKTVLDCGMEPVLQSNGLLLADATVDQLKELGLRRIVVSLDGLPARHDFMRRMIGGFDAAIAAVTLCVERGFTVRATTTADSKNLDDVVGLISLLQQLGVQRYSVNYATPMKNGRIHVGPFLDASTWTDLCSRLDEHSGTMDITYEPSVVSRASLDAFSDESCECKIFKDDWFLVRCDGEVFPCYLFFERRDLSLGNVLTDPLDRIFSTPGMAYVNRCGQQELPTGCAGCQLSDDCHGGCVGYRLLTNGGRDPRCDGPGASTAPICPFVKVKTATRSASNVVPY